MTRGFPGATGAADPHALVTIVNRLNIGKINCTGSVTLAANATVTTVEDARATSSSFIGLSPLTAGAAGELAAGEIFVSARANGSFALSHRDVPAADRTFVYAIIG